MDKPRLGGARRRHVPNELPVCQWLVDDEEKKDNRGRRVSPEANISGNLFLSNGKTPVTATYSFFFFLRCFFCSACVRVQQSNLSG